VEYVIKNIEVTLSNTERALQTLQPALNNLFAQADVASKNLLVITKQADSAIVTVTNTVNEKLELAENAMKRISEGAEKTNDIINSIEADPFYSKILYSSETVDKVNELVSKLNEIVRAIDTKGIKMLDENGNPVKPFAWKNLNLVGKTAREKARERAEKAQNGTAQSE
jgi:DNA repair ATPase RecN